jgi:hypothetical protein
MNPRDIEWVDKDWTNLTHDRGRWRAVVNMAMNYAASKNDVLWDMTPCGSSKNRRFRGNIASIFGVT